MKTYRLKKMREVPETARVGMAWTEEECESIYARVQEGVDYDTIAKDQQRSVGSVRARMIQRAYKKMEKEGISIEDAAKEIRLTPEDMEIFRKKKQDFEEMQKKRRQRYASAVATSPNPLISLLKRVTVRDETVSGPLGPERSATTNPGVVEVIRPNARSNGPTDLYLTVLTEIRDYLKIIAEK